MEEPKRLTPTKDTIRELFALSRNQCAFPGCDSKVIDEKGRLLAEVCHIEAAEKGGQRFNSSMTNEERRHVSNLIILCGPHHAKTNDVNEFPTPVLKSMKDEHESKSFLAMDELESQFARAKDLSAIVTGTQPKNLNKMNSIMGYTHDAQLLLDYVGIYQVLIKIPEHMRETLYFLMRKMMEDPMSGTDWYQVLWIVVKNEIGGISESELLERIRYLESKKFVNFDDDEELKITLGGPTKDNHLHWLLDFVEKSGTNLRVLIVNCKFDLLD